MAKRLQQELHKMKIKKKKTQKALRSTICPLMAAMNKLSISKKPRTPMHSWWECKLIQQFGNLLICNSHCQTYTASLPS